MADLVPIQISNDLVATMNASRAPIDASIAATGKVSIEETVVALTAENVAIANAFKALCEHIANK